MPDTIIVSTPELTVDQRQLILQVAREASLSDQHSDRQLLRDSFPFLMTAFDDSMEMGGNLKTANYEDMENRERWLSSVWPKGQTIAELDEDYVDEVYPEVKLFEFECGTFARIPLRIGSEFSGTVLKYEQTQKDSDESYAEDGETITLERNSSSGSYLIVFSSRVVAIVESGNEDFCDEHYDAIAHGDVYVSENRHQMLALVRDRSKGFFLDVDLKAGFEDDLKRIFGAAYEPVLDTPDPMPLTSPPKGPRP